MACKKEKDVMLHVLGMYRDMPHLWKKDHKDYLNREMRAQGFEAMLEVYKTWDEYADIKALKKKIENMRTIYFKELRKVRSLSAGAETSYEPTLWYFKALRFLDSTWEPSRVSVKAENMNTSSDDEGSSFTTSSTSQSKRQKINPPETIEMHKMEDAPLPGEKPSTKRKDDWHEVYGKCIGYQMKDLNKEQLIIAQKIISDVIFYAKLGKLTEHSCVVADPSREPMDHQPHHNYYTPLLWPIPQESQTPSPHAADDHSSS